MDDSLVSRSAVAAPALKGPRISVIIPVLGQADDLSRCLAALGRQDWEGDYEVIIVDNAPTPVPMPEAPAGMIVRHAHEPRPGSYTARNRGIRISSGAILAFTDADCTPDPAWLSAGIAVLDEDTGLDAVGGEIRQTVRDPDKPSWAELHQLMQGFQQEKYVRELRFGATANLFVRRKAFDRIGLFDDRLFSGADTEWGQRLHCRGGATGFSPDASVSHPSRYRISGVLRKRRRLTGGRVLRARGVGTRPMGRVSELQPGNLHDSYRHYRSDMPIDNPGDRVKLRIIELLLRATTRLERLRLAIGGSPYRS